MRTARVFEVDMPEVLSLRTERLVRNENTPASAIAVPIDFERDNLGEALRERGYASAARTLFLWEGVTYYLPEDAVKAVLSLVASHSGPGSTILFDYVTRAFVDGDYSAAPVGSPTAGDGLGMSTDSESTMSPRSYIPSASRFKATLMRAN
jgi:methyltransferase (TIGR00027 family)